MVDRVCSKFKIEPLLTLTSLSERLFDATIPILFRPEEDGAAQRAHDCYQSLLEEGAKFGCLPYRLNTKTMNALQGTEQSHWDFVGLLKKAIDPDGLMSPGRYCSPQN